MRTLLSRVIPLPPSIESASDQPSSTPSGRPPPETVPGHSFRLCAIAEAEKIGYEYREPRCGQSRCDLVPGIARGEKAAPEHDRGALWIAAAPGAEANSAHVMGFRSGVPAGESAPSWSCSFPRERKGDRSQRRLDDLQ